MKRVIIESPYAGDMVLNLAYAQVCMKDCLKRGEAPFTSHALYTQVLDDTIPEQRKQGMYAGWAWLDVSDMSAVYIDLGISEGMWLGIECALKLQHPIEFRTLGGNWRE